MIKTIQGYLDYFHPVTLKFDVPDDDLTEKELNPVAEMVKTAVVGLDKPMPRTSQRLTGLTEEYKEKDK